MKFQFHHLGILALAIASAAAGEPSKDQLAAASQAELRGAQLYAFDQAAWHATDRFQADMASDKGAGNALQAKGVHGYLVEPANDGLLLVSFYTIKDGKSSALARYWVAGSAVKRGGIVKGGEDSSLSALALRLIAAKEQAISAAVASKLTLCSKSPPNMIILPGQSDETVSVYLMTSTISADTYPAGGHYRFDIDQAGKLVSQRKFMNSCFPLDLRHAKGGSNAEMLFLTHLLDPQPTEIHVFVSYNIPMPLFVGAIPGNSIWRVARGKVSYQSDLPKR